MLLTNQKNKNPVKFNSIGAERVKKATSKTSGGAGPFGLDAEGWKRLFISTQLGDGTPE